MNRFFQTPKGHAGRLPAGVLLCIALMTAQGFSATFGRVAGSVTDSDGMPLMGVAVLLAGGGEPESMQGPVERVFTNAHGAFVINHLLPGWYSLQVISQTRLPAFRNRIQVKPGETTKATFALSDLFTNVRLPDRRTGLQAWGDKWKWILRTSNSTRPVLRYRKNEKSQQAEHHPSLPSRSLIAMDPGATHKDVLASDSGMGGVVAYFRPLDENSDVLVAGSVGDSTASDSSFVADYRRNILKRNRQEVSVVVHELRLANGLPGPAADKASGLLNARGMVLDYSQTRQLSDALTLTAGMEVKYLDSAQNAGAALPHVDLAYQLDPQTVLTVSYGMMDPGESSTLVDRVSELSTFPRVTMRNYKPRLEDDTHAEVRLERRLGAKSRIEVATYRDAFRDVAVWSIGGLHGLDSAGALQSVLFQPGGDRAVLNGGRYTSLGVRAAYDRQLGPHAGIGVMYSTGDALVVNGEGAGSKANFDPANVPSALRSEFTQAFSGKLSGYLPALKTQIITTYGWLPSGRVTLVDPYGLDRTQLQPFLGLEIRQPLPKIQILPVQIVAVADFRNLLGQGSVSMIRSNGKPVVLTPYCQSFRGGFAVQF